MSWNYRIVKQSVKHPTKKNSSYTIYGIHEAYYNEGEKKPHSITENSMIDECDTLGQLEWDLKHMLQAVKKARKDKRLILKHEDF